MGKPQRGEVWLVDLGLAAKVRPCLVLSISPKEGERALYTLIAHTTSIRDTRFEVKVQARFLRPGAFDAQNILTIPGAKLIRKKKSPGLKPRSKMTCPVGAQDAPCPNGASYPSMGFQPYDTVGQRHTGGRTSCRNH